MNLDLGTLCLIAIFVVVGLMLLSRLMNSGSSGRPTGGTDFSQRGSQRPTVDNPEVESRGGFGRDPAQSSDRGFTSRRPSFNMPIFRGSRRTGGSTGRVDNPEVKSRGSFGRSKDK
jgi:hypothetical protein